MSNPDYTVAINNLAAAMRGELEYKPIKASEFQNADHYNLLATPLFGVGKTINDPNSYRPKPGTQQLNYAAMPGVVAALEDCLEFLITGMEDEKGVVPTIYAALTKAKTV